MPTELEHLPASASPRSSVSAWWLGAILLLGAAAYAGALGFPMVFDDLGQILGKPMVEDLGAMAGAAGYQAMPNRFLANLTFALNLWAFGPAPIAFRIVNVGIHLLSGALVYSLIRTLLRTPRLRGGVPDADARAMGLVAAMLFVTHPIQTQAVTYLVQRITSLAALLYVATVLLYTRWRSIPTEAPGRRRAGWYVSALLTALLASRTKEIAATLPLALLLVELCFLEPCGRRRWLALLPFVAVAALIPLSLLGPGQAVTGSAIARASRVQTEISRLDYLLSQGPVVVSYLFLLLLPIGQSIDHDLPVRHGVDLEVASAIGVLVALLGLAMFLLRRTAPGARRPLDPACRLAAFGLLWWFLTLSVESSFIPIVDLMNEHRVYLPSVGAFTAAAVGLLLLARRVGGPGRAARLAVLGGAVLGITLAAATVARNRVWASDVSLWADAALKAPDKFRPNLNLGTALVEAGKMREALGPLRRAVALDPSSSLAHAQLGGALLASGRAAEAEPEVREALRLSPDDVEATFNLAMLLHQSGRKAEAATWFSRFLTIAPARYASARRFAEAHAASP